MGIFQTIMGNPVYNIQHAQEHTEPLSNLPSI